jgi:hypothetical protein
MKTKVVKKKQLLSNGIFTKIFHFKYMKLKRIVVLFKRDWVFYKPRNL